MNNFIFPLSVLGVGGWLIPLLCGKVSELWDGCFHFCFLVTLLGCGRDD